MIPASARWRPVFCVSACLFVRYRLLVGQYTSGVNKKSQGQKSHVW